MRRRSAVLRLGAVMLLVAGGLSACGVPLDAAARPVDGYSTPSPSVPAPTASGNRVVLWYVAGDSLTRTLSSDPAPVTPDGLLSMLAATPSRTGWRTLVADPQGGPPLAAVGGPSVTPVPSGDPLTIRLSDTFSRLAPADQVLLIGQVVLTLTEGSTRQLRFVDATDNPVTVPLPDGRLQDGPVARSDFLPLATRKASSSA